MEVIEPGVDRVGVAGAEQAGDGDGVGGVPVSDFEEGGAAFPDIRSWVVVAVFQELLVLAGVKL